MGVRLFLYFFFFLNKFSSSTIWSPKSPAPMGFWATFWWKCPSSWPQQSEGSNTKWKFDAPCRWLPVSKPDLNCSSWPFKFQGSWTPGGSYCGGFIERLQIFTFILSVVLSNLLKRTIWYQDNPDPFSGCQARAGNRFCRFCGLNLGVDFNVSIDFDKSMANSKRKVSSALSKISRMHGRNLR